MRLFSSCINSVLTLTVLIILSIAIVPTAQASEPKVRMLMRLQPATTVVLPSIDSILISTDTNLATFQECFTQHAADSIVRVSVPALLHYYVIHTDSSNADSIKADLDTVSFVDQIDLMPMAESHGTFNDRSAGNQWGLLAVNAFKAFDISAIPVEDPNCKCSPEDGEPKYVTIAVLDDAFCLDHEELDIGSNYIESYNASDGTTDVAPAGGEAASNYDLHESGALKQGSHGTFVAATAVAKAHNNLGIIGSGHGTKLMAIDVFEDHVGSLDPVIVVRGMTYAVENGADVVTMSFGIEYYSADDSRALLFAKAINDFFIWYYAQTPALYRKTGYQQRTVFIASAGNNTRLGHQPNDKKHPMYPANNFGVIAVGDITIGDHVSHQSMIGGNATLEGSVYVPAKKFGDPSRGGTLEAQVSGPSFVEIYAPGTAIMSAMSTVHNPAYATDMDKRLYTVSDGTSFAAPLVAGIVARMLMIYPNLTQTQVVNALKEGAAPGLNDFYRANYGRYYDSNDEEGHDCSQSQIDNAKAQYKLGYGKLNAFESLKYVRDFALPNPCASPLNPPPTVILKTTGGAVILPMVTQIGAEQSIKVSTLILPANYVVTLFARSDRPSANEYAIGTYTSNGTTSPSYTFTPNGGGVYTFSVSICIPNCKRRYVGSVSCVVSFGGSGCEILKNGSFENRYTYTNETYTPLNKYLDQPVLVNVTPQSLTPPWFRPVGSPTLRGLGNEGIKAYQGNWYASLESDLRKHESSTYCGEDLPSKASAHYTGQQQLAIPFKFRKGNTYQVCYAVRLSRKGPSRTFDEKAHVSHIHELKYNLYAANGVGRSITKYPEMSLASRLNGDEFSPSYGGQNGVNPWAEKIAPKGSHAIIPLPQPDPFDKNHWHGIPYNAGDGTITYTPTNDYEYLMIVGNVPDEHWQIDIDNVRITTGCAFQLPGDIKMCRSTIINPPIFTDGMTESEGGIPGAKVTWTLIRNNVRTLLGVGRTMPIGAFWAQFNLMQPPPNNGIGTYEIEVKIDDNERLCNAIVHRFKIISEDCEEQSVCTECGDLAVNAVYDATTCCYRLEVTNENGCYARMRELTLSSLPGTLEFSSKYFVKQGDKLVGDVILKSNETFSIGSLCLNGTSQTATTLNVGIHLQGVTEPCLFEVPLAAQQCLPCCPTAGDIEITQQVPFDDCERCCYDVTITRPDGCPADFTVNLEWAGDGSGSGTRRVKVPMRWEDDNVPPNTIPAVISDICIGKTYDKTITVSFSREFLGPVCSPPIQLEPPTCPFNLVCNDVTFDMHFSNAAEITNPDGTIQDELCCGWISPLFDGCVLSHAMVDVFVGGQRLGGYDGRFYICLTPGQPLGPVVIKDKMGNILCTKTPQFVCWTWPPPQDKSPVGDSTEVQTGAVRDKRSLFEVASMGEDGWKIIRLNPSADGLTSVLVIDVTGRVVPAITEASIEEVQIRCEPGLARGVYFIVVRTANGASFVRSIVR